MSLAIHTPRLLSLNAFVKLFEEHGKRSTLSKRVDHSDKFIEQIFSKLTVHEEEDTKLNKKIDNVEKASAIMNMDIVRDQNVVNEKIREEIEELKKTTVMQRDLIK